MMIGQSRFILGMSMIITPRRPQTIMPNRTQQVMMIMPTTRLMQLQVGQPPP